MVNGQLYMDLNEGRRESKDVVGRRQRRRGFALDRLRFNDAKARAALLDHDLSMVMGEDLAQSSTKVSAPLRSGGDLSLELQSKQVHRLWRRALSA